MSALDAIAILAVWFRFGLDMEWGPVQPTGEPVDPNLISWCRRKWVACTSLREKWVLLEPWRCVWSTLDSRMRIKTVIWLVTNRYAAYPSRICSTTTFFLWVTLFYALSPASFSDSTYDTRMRIKTVICLVKNLFSEYHRRICSCLCILHVDHVFPRIRLCFIFWPWNNVDPLLE